MIATDSFIRSNETPLAAPWGAVGTFTKPNLASNAVTGGDANGGDQRVARFTGVTTPPDQRVQATIAAVPQAGTANWLGVIARAASGAKNCYIGFVNGAGTWCIQKCINGSWTAIASVAGSVAVGDVIALEVIGNVVRLYKNGAQLLASNDSSGSPGNTLGAGDIGLATASTGSLKDWVGGSAALPPAPVLNGPIYTGETAITGLGSPGNSVEVTKNGAVQSGAPLVDSQGRWSFTFGAGLSTGDTIKVRQQDANQNWSAFSITITVQAAVLGPPMVLPGLYAGCTDVVGVSKPGVSVEVFKGGASQGSVVADQYGVWRLTTGGLTAGDAWTAKQTIAGTQSGASASVTVTSAPADTDTYKSSICSSLDTFDFPRVTMDNDDIRRSVAALLDRAALLASPTHDIKNSLLMLAFQYAARIRLLRG